MLGQGKEWLPACGAQPAAEGQRSTRSPGSGEEPRHRPVRGSRLAGVASMKEGTTMIQPARSVGRSRSEVAWLVTLVVVVALSLVTIGGLATLGLSDAAWQAWLGLW